MKFFPVVSVLILLFIFSGCSKKSDTDYMNMAKTGVSKNNISKAVLAYQDLINNYPKSPLAPQALFKLATLYQNKMVKNISQTESLEKAVSLFRSVFEKYPNSKLASKALFMSGFIQANELKAYNEATTTFNLFLQKFPNDELATSAKEELDNMGLTPEQILQKKKDRKISAANK